MDELPPRMQARPGEIPPKIAPDALAILSLVGGICSIVLSCSPLLSCVAGLAGLVCGLTSKTRVGARKAGIVCSIVGMVLILVWIIAAIALVALGAAAEGGAR